MSSVDHEGFVPATADDVVVRCGLAPNDEIDLGRYGLVPDAQDLEAAAAQEAEAAAERATRYLALNAPNAATDTEAHARMSANPTGAELRRKILDEVAGCVCRDRMNVYGDAEDNFADIAEFHTTYLRARGLLAKDAKIEAFDVAAMANLMKIARAANAPTHLDNWVDGAGYAVCGAGIVKRKLECA